MRKLMIVAVAAIAVTALSNSNSMAQTYQNSYRFGVGLGYGSNFGANQFRHRPGNGNRPGYGNFGGWGGVPFNAGALIERTEAPPFFAQFPPVYYNGIVPRPYGISPYAAPPGITPIEMGVLIAPPQTIHNPFFDQEVAPVSDPSEPVETTDNTDNKTTLLVDPDAESLVQK